MSPRVVVAFLASAALAACVTDAGLVGRMDAGSDAGVGPLDCTSLAIAPAASVRVAPLPALNGPLTLEGYVSLAGGSPTDLFFLDPACAGSGIGVAVNATGRYVGSVGSTTIESSVAASATFVHVALVVSSTGNVTFFLDGVEVGDAGTFGGVEAGCTLVLGRGVILGTIRVSNIERYGSSFAPSLTLSDDASTVVIVDVDTSVLSSVRGAGITASGNVRIEAVGPGC